MNELFFILVGYLSGSILYAYLLPKYICHIDIMKDSDDHNPGTFNAFALAGTQVGILVIALELLKGFLAILPARFIKQVVSVPIDSVIFYVLAKTLERSKAISMIKK